MQRYPIRKKFILLLILILAACGRAEDPFKTLTGGIEIQVLIGPMCPVVQEGDTCPDQPYQARLTILNTNRDEVLQFETDENGSYIANLPAGDYILRPESPLDNPIAYASEQLFTVRTNEITQIIITYDSGIR